MIREKKTIFKYSSIINEIKVYTQHDAKKITLLNFLPDQTTPCLILTLFFPKKIIVAKSYVQPLSFPLPKQLIIGVIFSNIPSSKFITSGQYTAT